MLWSERLNYLQEVLMISNNLFINTNKLFVFLPVLLRLIIDSNNSSNKIFNAQLMRQRQSGCVMR